MERCDKPASYYSTVNGFRCCEDCYKGMRPDWRKVMREDQPGLGPCDAPKMEAA